MSAQQPGALGSDPVAQQGSGQPSNLLNMTENAALPVSVAAPYDHTIVAECTRGGMVESVHYGSYAVVDAQGEVLYAGGSPKAAVYARSSLKPMQLLAMMRLGLQLPPDLLALASASHSGEAVHREGVTRILAEHNLDVTALRTPKDLPMEPGARADWLRAGSEATSLTHNCSGKHSAMLATCQINGWPTDSYLAPEHPLQQAIVETISELVGERPYATTADGCGAPLFAYSLTGLAKAFAHFAAAPEDSYEAAIRSALMSYPVNMSGTGREDVALMEAVPNLFTKGGAEGFQLAGLLDSNRGPVGIAIKISDGNGRACLPVITPILRQLGVSEEHLSEIATSPVLGGGKPVGEVRAAQQLTEALAS